MCPSPRPDSCGTAAPHAATSGASGSVILSPTPPVECLSTVGRATRPATAARPTRSSRASTARSRPRTCRSGRSPWPAPTSALRRRHRGCTRRRPSRSARRTSVPPSRLVRMTSTAAKRAHGRSSGPKASGSTSDIGRMPLRRVHQASGSAQLEQDLAAAPARHQQVTGAAAARHRDEPAAAGQPQLPGHRALGAQPEPVGRVLDVAPGDHAAVVDDRRRPRRAAPSKARTHGKRPRSPGARSASQSTVDTQSSPRRYGCPSAFGGRSRCEATASTISVTKCAVYGIRSDGSVSFDQ